MVAGLALTLLLTAGLSLVVYTLVTGISPMPTGPKVAPILKQTLAALYPESEQPPRLACELGCGWGGLLLALTALLPETRWLAWERSPLPYGITRLRLAARRRHGATVTCRRADFFEADLSEADLIVCYLYPGAMSRLAEKLAREAKATCWIVSHTFRLPGRKPDREIRCNDLYRTPIYCYRGGGMGQHPARHQRTTTTNRSCTTT